MFKFEFKKRALKEIERLPIQDCKRIFKKLQFYSYQNAPLKFAVKIKDKRFGEYRFRIGEYRVIFETENQTIIILKVGHRRDIYKGK